MLDKLSTMILENISERELSDGEYFDFTGDLERISSDIGKEPRQVKQCLDFLAENGLIEILYDRLGVACGFRPTHRGRNIKEFKMPTNREKRIERLYGFVSGVLVTVIGGLIIKWFSG